MTQRVAILISGGGSNMVALAEAMTGTFPARPCLVLSNKPEAGGLAKAKALGIPTAVVDHRDYKGDRPAFDAAVHKELLAHTAEVVCLAGFMRIFTPEFMGLWYGKMLNIHPALLPKHKGLHTHQQALDAGDTVHGCTVHEVIAELDAGPILGQARVPVADDDTPETLAAKVLPFEHQLYPAVLRRFVSGDKTPVFLP